MGLILSILLRVSKGFNQMSGYHHPIHESGHRWAAKVRQNILPCPVRHHPGRALKDGYDARLRFEVSKTFVVVVNLVENQKKAYGIRVRVHPPRDSRTSNLKNLRTARAILRAHEIPFRDGYRSLSVAPMKRADLEMLIKDLQAADAITA